MRTAATTTRADDLIADYSSRGPTWYDASAKPDLVAPGHRLVGAADAAQSLNTLYPSLRAQYSGRPYLRLSGSSIAAGVVSGAPLVHYWALRLKNVNAGPIPPS